MSETLRCIRKLNIGNTPSKKEANSIVEQKKQQFIAIVEESCAKTVGDITFAHMAHILHQNTKK